MSWFKRKPRLKEPQKQHPHHSSPAAEKLWKETLSLYQQENKKEIETDKSSEKKL
jgi:hypothetical protein